MSKTYMTKIAASTAIAAFALSGVAFAADANVGVRAGFMMNGAPSGINGGPVGARGDMNNQAEVNDQGPQSQDPQGPNDGQGRSGYVQSVRQGMMMNDGSSTRPGFGFGRYGMMQNGTSSRPAVIGVVTAINGSAITIASRGFAQAGNGERSATSTRQRGMHASSTRMGLPMMPPIMATSSFSIDASSATIIKAGATTTLSSVSVGDFILVRGTVSGTQVTATEIRDTGANPPMMAGREGRGMEASTTASSTFGFGRGGDDGSNSGNGDNQPRGFFGSIGHFFKSLFGF